MNKTLVGKFLESVDTNKLFKHSSSNSNLPLISLNQLETQINFFKKKKTQNFLENDDLNPKNHKQFNVCSPFYDRMKAHKQNCKCPYHRKKRLQIIPLRHTDKTGKYIHKSLGKKSDKDHQKSAFRFSSKQNHPQMHHFEALNSSFDTLPNKFLHTAPEGLKHKIDSRNITYEEFLKQCEYFMLKKNGFTVKQSSHVIRKGVRQIFQFINDHLDYSTQKMTNWINKTQKDKDYGQFYIDRFKQMKINYQNNLKRGFMKKQRFGNTCSYSLRTKNNQNENEKKKQDQNSFKNNQKGKFGQNQTKKYKSRQLSQEHSNQNESNSQNGDYGSKSSSSSNISLQKIFIQLKENNKVCNQNLSGLMNMDIQSFKKMFENLQHNILNFKYEDDLLKKFQQGVLTELIRKCSNSDTSQISNQKDKFHILSQTHDLLRKYRNKRSSRISERNSMKSTASKPFFGSKRNTQNAQNNKNTSMHSKKSSSGDCSMSSSQRTSNETSKNEDNLTAENNFGAIEEENQNQEQHSNNQKLLKTIINCGQNIRRSKLLKPQDMFKFNEQHIQNSDSNEDFSDLQLQRQKSVSQTHKGFFRKAEKYLFEVNMGKAIIKKDDSIFTAKRKVRVIKMLLKQNPATPQAQQLKDYIKTVEDRCKQKTQKDKKLNLLKKQSENAQNEQDNIWRHITIETMGYNLIFYNLTSKIKFQDNQDLCILLHELKLSQAKKLQNKTSYKNHLILQQQQEMKRLSRKNKCQDVLIQDEMRNMQFQPEIQSEKQIDCLNLTKRTTKTCRKSLLQLSLMAKQQKISAIFNSNNQIIDNQDELDQLDQKQIEQYYQHIKKLFKYAKINLPQTFDTYVKNTTALSRIKSRINQSLSYRLDTRNQSLQSSFL